jgi:arginyl-tRNA synthetase
MILPQHQLVREHLARAVSRLYGLAEADTPAIVVQVPPSRALGDLAVPIAFELARRVRKAPRVIASEIVAALGDLAPIGVARVEAASGYLNFFLDRPAFLRARLAGGGPAVAPGEPPGKAIVEHTAINPNKAAHIGHLRNAALGDALGRLLRFRGQPVEIQNYIDDTGVQVADVVVGFRELERKGFDEIRQLADSTRFDYFCWDLYAAVTEWYEADQSRLHIRTATLHDIERGGNENARIAGFIADRIVRCHLATMKRMNVGYDLLTWEGDILRLQFWAHAFESLKARGSVFLQTEGRLAGCWVMRIEDEAAGQTGTDERAAAENDADAAGEAREKVIVRSDGTVTYVGKDIAYQFWKFGLLGKDFHYRVFETRPGTAPLWATTSDPARSAASAPSFGRAHVVFNVIDTRQSYLQNLLKQALASMGFTEQAERSIHYAYEMVALSHQTARQLGYQAGDEEGKPFVEVSGRKGLGVKADDLLDRLNEAACAEVAKRNPELLEEERREIASAIATAAVRYFLIKFSRGKVIAFDIDEALSFEGETGPYIQYAVVRANNIFRKLQERDGLERGAVVSALAAASVDALASGEGDELWDLVLESARLDEVADQAIRSLELSVVAKYAFGLAQSFNAFYHKHQILNEARRDIRLWRAATVAYFRDQLARALDLMGCQVPSRM